MPHSTSQRRPYHNAAFALSVGIQFPSVCFFFAKQKQSSSADALLRVAGPSMARLQTNYTSGLHRPFARLWLYPCSTIRCTAHADTTAPGVSTPVRGRRCRGAASAIGVVVTVSSGSSCIRFQVSMALGIAQTCMHTTTSTPRVPRVQRTCTMIVLHFARPGSSAGRPSGPRRAWRGG